MKFSIIIPIYNVENYLRKCLDSVASQTYNNFEVVEYDYDFDEDEVKKYDVGKILPVLIFFDENNNEVSRLIGERSYDEILREITRGGAL